MGLVAGVELPRVARAPGPLDLNAKALEVAAVLRTDRNAAAHGGADVVTQIDIANGVVLSGIGVGRVDVPRGVKVDLVQSSRELRPGGGGIRFLGNGRSSGGVVFLSRNGVSFQIAVNWLTSAVIVSPGFAPQPVATQ
jgi:general secretion pathway protein H